jgi:hypothetical protein
MQDLQQVRKGRVTSEGGAVSTKPPPYKSKLELTFAVHLETRQRKGEIDGWLYEPFSFKLAAGKRYRVDFISWKTTCAQGLDGAEITSRHTTAYEVKGWHKNYRDALTHLKWAAQRFPFLQWKKVVRTGKTTFDVMEVVV